MCIKGCSGFCWALAVASSRINKVDRGKARVCHFGPYREYRENEARRGAEQNPLVRNLVSCHPTEKPNKFQLQ